MENIKIWLSAIRLRTLPLSISGIILAACFAEYNGTFSLLIFVLAICTTLSLQILSNLANDYGDGVKGTDNEDRIGPERAIQSGKIKQYQMYRAIKLNIIITILFSFILIFNAFGLGNFLYSIIFFILGGFAISSAIRYTVGKSPYGYKGLGDLFVFIFFGLVSVIGSYFLFAKKLDHLVILPAISVGLLSMAVLNLNNMRDIESDIKSNKMTFAAKLGAKQAKIYHNILIILAMIFTVLFGLLYYVSPFNFLFLIAFIPLMVHLINVNKISDPNLLNPQLKVLAFTTLLFSILLGIGYLL